MKKLTTEQFIKKASKLHNNKYDYIESKYINAHTKIKIICPKHGEFFQTPNSHLSARGCPECSKKISAEKRTINSRDFIKRCKFIHKNKYFYDNVSYKNLNSKIKIICPIHGEFEQKARYHLYGAGCKKCGTDNLIKTKKLTRNNIIKRFNIIHENKYDYSLIPEKIEGVYMKIEIICPKHGVYEQIINDHFVNGCPKCAGNYRYSKDEMIERMNKIHENKYDYSKVEYTNINTKVTIICSIHGEFEQIPKNHLKGFGCLKCAYENVSWNRVKEYKYLNINKGKEIGIIYQLKMFDDHETFYKIGITSQNVKDRMKLLNNYKYEIIDQIYLTNLETAILEREIKRNNKHLRYIPINKFGGYTECFREKIDLKEYINATKIT